MTMLEKLNQENRFHEMDGIRGWAALCVLIFHVILSIYSHLHIIADCKLLNGVFDGGIAVYIFFILSGDVLSLKCTSGNTTEFPSRMFLKRYFRLAGPCLFSCTCVYFLMKSGFVYNHKAAIIVNSENWLGSFLPFKASLYDMLRYSLCQVFTSSSPVEISYNTFLWTMKVEIWGSFLIFMLAPLYHLLKKPLLFLGSIALFLAFFGEPLACFFIGVILGRIRQFGVFDRMRTQRFASVLLLGLIPFIFMINSYGPHVLTQRIGIKIIFAATLMISFYSSKYCFSFMKNHISQFLGKVSFPLYYMQFPVIVSWSSWCIISKNSLVSSPLFVISTTFTLVFLVAYITSLIEERYLKFIESIPSRIMKVRTNT